MKVQNILWWISFTCIAIALQSLVPGVDFLIPGFIVLLQERSLKQFLWVTGIFLILQEGMGTMAFGSVLLWYFSAVALFILGKWLFEVESLAFILLLSVALSVTRYAILVLFANLQDLYLNEARLFDYSVYQALLMPFLWNVASFTRRGLRHAVEV